ncbi:MAG: phosphatidylserine decarboxylase [Candidatus Aenigmarchaeota archaeon]|nr:phosphatidylserine decarboxylase [Candidatus Aenigmarchaeota archaeon]
MIARGCSKWITTPFILLLISTVITFYNKNPLLYITSFLLALITCFFMIFFRDPQRIIPKNPKAIVSAADGTVIKVDSIGNFSRIAVFMKPQNVHVNRSPIKGKVLETKRFSGSKEPAYKDYAENNERLLTKLSTKIGPVNVVQITGFVARRIESYVNKNQYLEKGQRIGIIKLGSRCDIYLPRNKIRIVAKVGDNVTAGESIVAFIK